MKENTKSKKYMRLGLISLGISALLYVAPMTFGFFVTPETTGSEGITSLLFLLAFICPLILPFALILTLVFFSLAFYWRRKQSSKRKF